MNILFATGHAYLPQTHGGLQNSTHELCQQLIRKGHNVAVLASLRRNGWIGWNARIRGRLHAMASGISLARDVWPGYPVWRSWKPWNALPEVVERQKTDAIVVLSVQAAPMAAAAEKTGLPFLMQLLDVEFDELGGDFSTFHARPCIANSRFTAATYREAFGVEPTVIYPLIDPDSYRTRCMGDKVVFINPAKKKGVDIAIAVARLLPSIEFLFVETWPLLPQTRARLLEALSGLPNVTLCGPFRDMRPIYSQARVLLVPSTWNEAYGRVAMEAQINGIPVVASDRGGLPEAVGPGGLVIASDAPAETWAGAVRDLHSDPDMHRQYCHESA